MESGAASGNMKLMMGLQSLMASQKAVQQTYENLDWIMHTHRIKATNEPLTVESVVAAIDEGTAAIKSINDDCAISKCLLPKKTT